MVESGQESAVAQHPRPACSPGSQLPGNGRQLLDSTLPSVGNGRATILCSPGGTWEATRSVGAGRGVTQCAFTGEGGSYRLSH